MAGREVECSMIGARLGDYLLEASLGQGGMGEVYRAYDTRRERTVALKLLFEHLAADHAYQERFRRESHVAARLTEPHVIPIHDYGEIEGRLFIDMRLVDGMDLGKLLSQTGPMPPDRAVSIVGQIAGALDAAHSDGLVHRDVKPANVLVTGDADFVYLADFGVAYATGSSHTLTATGSPIGTPDYMAPERFDGKPADHRVDIYSLACVLHECVTSVRPFIGGSFPALMRAHLFDPPPIPSRLCPGIPLGLDHVVAKGMAKDPNNRYPTAGELANAARAALAVSAAGSAGLAASSEETVSIALGGPPPAPPVLSPPHTGPPAPRRRSRSVDLALGGVLLVAVAVLAVVLFMRLPAEPAGVARPSTSTGGPATTGINPTSSYTAAALFGADPRNGECKPRSEVAITTRDIEVLECVDQGYVRYFYKYSGINRDAWLTEARTGNAKDQYGNLSFVRADSCYDTYTAAIPAENGKTRNTALFVFKNTPFVAEVYADASVADLAMVLKAGVSWRDGATPC